MTDLNIKSFFTNACGQNNLIEKSDVEEGRISKNIAKALGIIDENGNYTDKTYTLVQFASNTNIEDLLEQARIKSDSIRAGKKGRVNENGSNVVSQKSYNMREKKGTLYKYEDGSIEFDASDGIEVFSIKFKNEDDFKNNRPYREISGNKFKTRDGREVNNLTTINYEYHSNGKRKHLEKTYGDNNTILETYEYDDKGYLISGRKNNSKGELKETFEGQWEDENTHVINKKDKNGNYKQKIVTKTKDGEKESRSVYDHNGTLREEIQYNDGKISSQKIYFPDGKLNRKIEYFPNGGIKSIETYNKDGKTLQNYTADMVPDGKSWDKASAQVGEGDCYLVASINAIRELSNGDELLSSLIDIKTDSSGKKTYTVTLPGAQIAAKGLLKDKHIAPNKMYITGVYTFTEEDVDRITHQQGINYSIGNANVVLLEAAFEQYRKEVYKTVKENDINPNRNQAIPGLFTNGDNLSGGLAFDAIFVLTGKPSEVYTNKDPDCMLDIQALRNGEVKLVRSNKNNNGAIKASPSSIDGDPTNQKSDLDIMLDKIMQDLKDGSKDIIATVGFKTYNGETMQTGGHALTIVDVTDKTVTMVNPWHPDTTITMSREDFIASADMVTVCNVSKETKITEREVNGNKKRTDSHNGKKPQKPEQKPDSVPQRTPDEEKEDKKKISDLFHRFKKDPKHKNNKSGEKSKLVDIINIPSKKTQK